MSDNKKSANSFDARRGPAASRVKAGSRSPGHRGYRPTDEGPKKRRWSADERAARTDRPSTGDRAARGDRPAKTDHAPYGDRPPKGDHAPRGDKSLRKGRQVRSERSAYGERAQRATADKRGSREYSRRPDRTVREGRPDREGRRDNAAERAGGDRRTHGARGATNGRHGDRDRNHDRGERRDNRGGHDSQNRFRGRGDTHNDFRGDRDGRRVVRAEPTERSGFRGRRDAAPVRDHRDRVAPTDDTVLKRLEAETISHADVEGVSFADLGLGDNIVRTLAELGAPSPFPIQAATIPDVISGRDVLGRGRTGSGKTIAFAAPVVERLMENNGGKGRKPGRKPRALVIAPTRELALQIDRTVQPIARSVGLFTTQIYGGVPQHRQVMALQRGVDIVIGTPGRIEDLIEQGRLDLSEVTMTVLDEADHMCDLGFLEPVQRVLRETADGGQRLLFSATLDAGVSALVAEFLIAPAVHEVAGEDQASSTIDHRILLIEQRDKVAVIEDLVDRNGKTLVFARTRAFAEQLADQLDDAGIPATSLHGDLNQSRRTRNLAMLTSGRVNVLVATDVAARGIHVDDISLVIQADAPDEYKTYMHRSGRTGRAGKQGTVVTLVPRSRRRRMEGLLDRAEISADVVPVAPGDDVLRRLATA